ncbi:MAG: 30S ribosomal protein S20 [Leptospira sp.]|nr:30S ribosomal protein S20 [Leptospira sp.]
MANLKSSKKDVRRSEKRRIENSQRKTALRTFSKNIVKSIKAGKKEEALKLFSQFTSLLDKAAKKNIIHKKNADRNKSRFSAKINSLK